VAISIQNRLSDAVYRVLFASGAARVVRRSHAVVFCYHNVVPDHLHGRVGDPYLHTSVSDFNDQLDFITDAYQVVAVGELVSRLRNGLSIAGLAALTFDDGYLGAINHAIPRLRQAGVPFTLFPVVDAATKPKPFWWDLFTNLDADRREYYLNELKGDFESIESESNASRDLPSDALPASWDQLRAVSGADCTIGVHTVTHRNLSALPREEVRWELTYARDRIAAELNVTPSLVTYPYGRSNDIVKEETKLAGFEAGFGLASNLVRAGVQDFEVPRINVPAGIALPSFACWSSGLKLRR
jgi:peptidoglycan/xylan/chitin deacetylase (PgdA/CDA1 family)